MKPLKDVMILQTTGDPKKLSTVLKAMHLGDRIEIYEEEQSNGEGYAQRTIATIPVHLCDWNKGDS